MKIQRIKSLGQISDNDYINWKRLAIQSGYITEGTSFNQMDRIWQMQQIQNAGLDPSLSLDQANAVLATGQLRELIENNLLGEEVLPLIQLYLHNPTLASELTTRLFDSGYMTLDERNKKAESPLRPYREGTDWLAGAASDIGLFFGFEDAGLDKDNKSLEDYDHHAFNYFYRLVKEERKKIRTKIGTEEEQEESIKQEARRRYLSALNSNIFGDIKKEIDNYYSLEADNLTPQMSEFIKQASPQELTQQLVGEGAMSLLGQKGYETPFDILVLGSTETILTSAGDVDVQHPGSRYWRAYKDTSVFDNFEDADKLQIMAKYLAYKQMLGEDKANEYLESAMQSYVALNRGWGKAIADVAGGVGTTAGLIIPEAVAGISGLAWDILGTILPDDYGGRYCLNQASITLTGRDLLGRAIETPDIEGLGDFYKIFSNGYLNMGYLNKVSQYKNWDIEEIKKAEANGGVGKDAMYVVDPTVGHQFKHDALDMLDMTGQAIGQIALAYLTSGASLEAKAAATMGKTAAAMRVGAEIATTTAPIASAYAVGAANEAYNNTIEQSNEIAYKQALTLFNLLSQTEEYQRLRKEAVDQYFNLKGRKGLDGTVYLAPFETDEARKQQEDIYDQQLLKGIYDRIVAEREQNTNQIALNSSLLAYRASASVEALKYGYTTAMFGSWKLSGNANKLLEQNLGVKTYGKVTQDAAGKFTREGIHPLGIKKLTLSSPNQIAAWRTAESAIIGGGLSNYTDDVTTGFAVGLSLGYSNSSLLREYDPQAYADTWYSDSEAAQALYILGSGVEGAADMVRSGQPWHSFYIGVGGSFLGAGFRFRGRDQVRQQYQELNQRYEAETGKKVSSFTKFRQGVNTYTLTLWSTYEDARMGVNRLDLNIKAYNEALDKRQDALNEIASMRQGLIKRRYANNEMSFSDATLESDNLALKLISIQHSLQSNPLRQLDKQKFDTELEELYDIAQDNVSNERKESLIQSAYGARELDKSKPLTDLRKAEIWEDIKANARRFSDFSSDYYEAVDLLKHEDKSFEEPKNWPLLHQKAELIAKSKRIQRDIDTLSGEVGINVDTSVTDRTQGELTETARKSSIKAAQETISKLQKQREKAQERIDELNSKEKLSETEAKDLAKQSALIMRADRAIPRLEAEIDNLEEGTSLVQANAGLTTNVILLHNMLSSPELYTTEQQGLINRFKAQIGEKGVLYVLEMAKMQDQLNEMNDAQEALAAHPETFQALVTGLQDIREAMGEKAIYNTKLLNNFNFLKSLPSEEIGANSAMSLTSELFNQFMQENPELAATLEPYREMNTSFSHIYSLTQTAKDSGAIDELTQKDILTTMLSLALQDSDYIVDNGRLAIADMLEFLIATDTLNPTKVDAMKTLLTDFKRVASIDQSTVAYTEYKIKKMAEQSQRLAEQLMELMLRQQEATQQQVLAEQTSQEEVPSTDVDMSNIESMEHETGEAVNILEGEEEAQEGTSQEESTQEDTQTEEESQQALEAPTDTLPAGVTRNSEGEIETMTAEQEVEQLGITKVQEDSLVDDSAPIAQEVTEQQEEVHGCYFNMYEGRALKAGELIPYTEGPVYEWLSREGINLGAIIDNELHNILKANSKVQLMKVKREGGDTNVASNIFLVVEYTDSVAEHHLPENGGIITSNGKRYLIVGTMWNTKAQDGTQAADIMLTTRNNLQRNGVSYFDTHPSERFYVDPVMNTEVTTFYSGHVVHTVDGESQPHTLTELIDEHNRTHTSANLMDVSDLGFGVITMKEGFYPVGPHSSERIHAPLKQTVDKYGQVYVLVPAANGEIVPIFINPVLLSEINEGSIKRMIDTEIIPKLLSENYDVREEAIGELCLLLCISGSVKDYYGKGIVIGTRDVATVSLMNGKSVVRTFDIKKQNFTVEEFRKALYELNPRINLSLSNLAQPIWIQRYDEAGALTTDSAKLGTFGGKYYVAPINPATGQPMRTEQKAQPVEVSSDYSKASATPVMLPVGGQTYVFRNGKWVNQKDGKAVTDNAELAQIAWALKVQNGEASLALRQGSYDYYIAGIETSNPVVVAYNTKTRSYERVVQAFADLIVAERRAELEKNRADAEAKKQLESRLPVEEAPDIKLVIDQEALEDVAEPQLPNTLDKTLDVEVSTTENIKPTNVESFLSSILGPLMYFGAIAKNNLLGYTKVVPEDSARILGKVEDNKVILVPISNVPNVIGSDYYKNSFEVLHEEQSGNLLYVIKPAVATQLGEKFVVEKKGVIVIANSELEATKIYNKYHHTKLESTILKEAATEQRLAQLKLARVEEALNSPEVKLWSDNPLDNVIITTSYDGFSSPMKESRLWRTAGDYRDALKMNEGDVFRDKFRVVYKGKNGITYIEKLNAKDGQVKSAIVVPTSGRGGDNYTLHFYTTLDTASRRLIIDKLIDMKGAYSEELMSAALMLMLSGNNLSYLQYRDLKLLNELKSKASGNNTLASPAKLKNDFELKQSKKLDKQSIESMLDNFSDEAVMEQVDKIYSIVEAKIADAKAGKLDLAHTEKWINFDTSNLQSELERIGIQTDNIEDVESWIDNLENCE